MYLQNPIILIWDALLRPSRFAALLATGWRQVIYAWFITLLWTFTLLVCINLLLRQIMPPGPNTLVLGIVLPPTLLLLSTSLGQVFMSKSNRLNIVWFWTLRPQIAMAPSLGLLTTIGFSTGFDDGSSPWSIWLVLVTIFVFGTYTGSFLGLGFAGVSRPVSSLTLRVTIALMALGVGVLSWWSPQLIATNLRFLSLVMAGLVLGILRPLSWLCEAPVSLGLLRFARTRWSVDRLRRSHPTAYDELILLPLPGLRALLRHACSTDLSNGITWLLEIAAHPGQHLAAYAAMRQLIQEGPLAHKLLLQLSSSAAGRALLHEASARLEKSARLTWTYVMLAEIREPGAWIEHIDSARDGIAAWPDLPGTPEMLWFLASSSAILHADRWETAHIALQSRPASSNQLDEIAGCCALLDCWLKVATADVRTGMQQLDALVNGAELPASWAGSLLATVGAHLCFLVSVEHRRREVQSDAV